MRIPALQQLMCCILVSRLPKYKYFLLMIMIILNVTSKKLFEFRWCRSYLTGARRELAPSSPAKE